MVDGFGMDSGQHDSPWAPSLFVEIDSQHMLFDDEMYSEAVSAAREQYSILDDDTPQSTQNPSWIDPALSSTTPVSDAQDRRVKLPGRWRDGRQVPTELRLGGDSITISSHLFNGIGNVPLSLSVNMQSSPMQDLTAPAWSVTSMYHHDDPDMMSRVYVDFIVENKRLIANGMPPERMFGSCPDVEALLNEAAFHGTSGLSQWTARLANSFGIPSMTCRLAFMWLAWHLMRWVIHPTPETYLAIPDWYKPTPYQMFFLHPIYADFHIWPRFRDVVIQRIDLQYQPKYWFSEAAKTVDCNWTSSLQDALCYDGAGKLSLVPVFVQHIMDLGNWTIGPVIRKHIPDADAIMQIRYGPM